MNLFTFSRHFKHVDVYIFDGSQWTGFRMASDGITYAVSGFENGRDLLIEAKKLEHVEAILGVDLAERAHFGWSGLTIPMCNELCRALTGIDVGFTWSPRHLYNKLLKYDQKRNFEIFYRWRRDNGE